MQAAASSVRLRVAGETGAASRGVERCIQDANCEAFHDPAAKRLRVENCQPSLSSAVSPPECDDSWKTASMNDLVATPEDQKLFCSNLGVVDGLANCFDDGDDDYIGSTGTTMSRKRPPGKGFENSVIDSTEDEEPKRWKKDPNADDEEEEAQNQRDMALACEMQKQLDAEAMTRTRTGRAWNFVSKVIEMHETLFEAYHQFQQQIKREEVSTVATDDMVWLVERMLECQEEFQLEGKPDKVDIGYHYTRSSNMQNIRRDGLLTRVERDERNVRAWNNGSAFGDGVYTGNNPFAFRSYGDIMLLVARIKGSVRSGKEYNEAVRKHRQGQAAGVRTNRAPVDAVEEDTAAVGADTIEASNSGRRREMIVLRKSCQCVALVQFDSSIVQTNVDDASGDSLVHLYHEKLQGIIDEFFNGGCKTVVHRVPASELCATSRGLLFGCPPPPSLWRPPGPSLIGLPAPLPGSMPTPPQPGTSLGTLPYQAQPAAPRALCPPSAAAFNADRQLQLAIQAQISRQKQDNAQINGKELTARLVNVRARSSGEKCATGSNLPSSTGTGPHDQCLQQQLAKEAERLKLRAELMALLVAQKHQQERAKEAERLKLRAELMALLVAQKHEQERAARHSDVGAAGSNRTLGRGTSNELSAEHLKMRARPTALLQERAAPHSDVGATVSNLTLGRGTFNEGPKQIRIENAGNTAVNGLYSQDGYFETACRYVMDGKWKGNEYKFYILQLTLSNNTKRWYISIVPHGGNPGTSSDIDFYKAPVSPECRRVPPRGGWIKANEGRDPPPILSHKRDETNEISTAYGGSVSRASSSAQQADQSTASFTAPCSMESQRKVNGMVSLFQDQKSIDVVDESITYNNLLLSPKTSRNHHYFSRVESAAAMTSSGQHDQRQQQHLAFQAQFGQLRQDISRRNEPEQAARPSNVRAPTSGEKCATGSILPGATNSTGQDDRHQQIRQQLLTLRARLRLGDTSQKHEQKKAAVHSNVGAASSGKEGANGSNLPSGVSTTYRGRVSRASSNAQQADHQFTISYTAPDSMESADPAKSFCAVDELDSIPKSMCSVCLDPLRGENSVVVALSGCGHHFHRSCIESVLRQHTKRCPICRISIGGEPLGKMPSGRMTVKRIARVCRGHDEDGSSGSLEILYDMQGGTQKRYHENPGRRYGGTQRTAYLPDNADGRNLLKRLRYAFSRGMTFTVGTSLTTRRPNSIVWSSIHHKTALSGGSHGFPDPGYFLNCNEDLDALGVPPADDCD